MATVEQLLDVARSQIGYRESPAGSNQTKYGRWYGFDGQPWCAMFTSWCLDKIGIRNWKFAYTPAGVEMFKQAERWFSSPKPGDLAFFDFPDSVHRVQHVGFVEKVNEDGTVTCLEGNTSVSSNDNGGSVMRRIRSRSLVVGFGRPEYSTSRPWKVVTKGKGGKVVNRQRFGRFKVALNRVRRTVKRGKTATIKKVR